MNSRATSTRSIPSLPEAGPRAWMPALNEPPVVPHSGTQGLRQTRLRLHMTPPPAPMVGMDQEKADATILAWETQLTRDGSVQLKPSRGKLFAYLLACLVFTAGGVLILFDSTQSAVFGVLAIVFFGGMGIPTLLVHMVRDETSVSITSASVSIADKVTVPWDDVADVSLIRTGAAQMVSLRVRDEEAQRRALAGSRTSSSLRKLSNHITDDLDIPLPTGLKADPIVFATWLARVHARAVGPQQPN